MKNILIINGHQKFPYAEGRLNQTLFENMVEFLSVKYEIKTTVLEKGYIPEEEQDKFKWADVVILQFPIFWYSVPGLFKAYMDKVYAPGVFFMPSCEKYGKSGLLNGKKYMLSLTMSSCEKAFSSSESFLEGKSIDELLVHLHKTHQYCGMEPLDTFALYNVVKSPQILEFLDKLQNHVKRVFKL